MNAVSTVLERRSVFSRSRRIIVKVGSSLLADPSTFRLRRAFLHRLAQGFCAMHKQNKEVVLVTSGAIAAGLVEMGLRRRPSEIPKLQALAAVGQTNLMHAYETAFQKYRLKAAQILLTQDDLSNRRRFLNARNAFLELFRWGVIPIVNENDTVVVKEIKFGDNDTLAALMCDLVDADMVLFLTDAGGFYETDPRKDRNARRLEDVRAWKSEWDEQLQESGSAVGTGGIATKLAAAKRLTGAGIPVVFAGGNSKNFWEDLMNGKDIGTWFWPRGGRMGAKKRWLSLSGAPKGDLWVDAGAAAALRHRKASLLPKGVVESRGHFWQGDVVRVLDPEGREVGRGIVNYSSAEIQKIRGCATSAIVDVLGYKVYDEVVHRDHFILRSEDGFAS